jgi:hypothetical protein
LFEGRYYPISHRAILTLVTVAGCNAACKFCSNEITFTPGGPYLRYDQRLERVRRLALLAGVTKVAFTGGEPTVHPQKLYDLASEMIAGFSRARLHTNGFGLLRDVRTPSGPVPLLDALINVGLSGASLSVAHHEPPVNRVVMGLNDAWAGITEDELREIARRRGAAGFAPRLSCVLTREGVYNLDGLLEYLEWGRSLGFQRFIFRSPSGIPDQYSKRTQYTSFNAGNHLDIHELTSVVESLPGWRQTYVQHKSDSHVHVYEVDGECTVDIDDSAEEEDPDDKIRRLTVMPNGVLYSSWIDPFSALFPEDQELAARDATRELPEYARGARAWSLPVIG